ncbi:prefoldin subunit 3, variant [Neurospora crassa OR74A]|uniref:Prefoldin subunit 3, variant n=1 Tax=Neurospora crassa (strain ATCC 24698 / 74-OR23-1A / CBS 708.71 / DSM 1257 / FGSC 987) TaxID=367110 RepID=V5IKN3_NEUCR|nr:prefoldin subunit 3, variant [Neurospora crassa OR74A]ESA42017.1 prefoldin subunit 3, variant [Neurospora crassa OR74A]|eukprot:XP_011395123.1 prefoldin subunit 3, variant [Neurospora crassa OR74A]
MTISHLPLPTALPTYVNNELGANRGTQVEAPRLDRSFPFPLTTRHVRSILRMATKGKEVETAGRDATPANPRGIPQAPFVDKVEDYVTSRADVEPTLRRFQELIAKYQFMEQNLQRRVVGLKDKMPDIQKTLDTVRFLQMRKVRHTHTHTRTHTSVFRAREHTGYTASYTAGTIPNAPGAGGKGN